MTMTNNDLTYSTSGLFTRFFPETEAGKVAWYQMNAEDGGDIIYTTHLPNVLAQLQSAGYTVGKAAPVSEEMLAMLEKMAAIN